MEQTKPCDAFGIGCGGTMKLTEPPVPRGDEWETSLLSYEPYYLCGTCGAEQGLYVR